MFPFWRCLCRHPTPFWGSLRLPLNEVSWTAVEMPFRSFPAGLSDQPKLICNGSAAMQLSHFVARDEDGTWHEGDGHVMNKICFSGHYRAKIYLSRVNRRDTDDD